MVKVKVHRPSTKQAGPWTPRHDGDVDDFFNSYNQVKIRGVTEQPEENVETMKQGRKKKGRRKTEEEVENADVEETRERGQVDKTADVCNWLGSMPAPMVEPEQYSQEPAKQPDTPDSQISQESTSEISSRHSRHFSTPDTLPQEQGGHADGEIQEHGGASEVFKPSKRKTKSWPALADSGRGHPGQNAVSKSMPALPAVAAPKAQKVNSQIELECRSRLQHSKSLSSLRPTVHDVDFEGANAMDRSIAKMHRYASHRALIRIQNDCYKVREKENKRDVRGGHCSEWQKQFPREQLERSSGVVKKSSMLSNAVRPDLSYDHDEKKRRSHDVSQRADGVGKMLKKQVSKVNLNASSPSGPLSNAMRYNAAAPKDPSETVAFLLGMERAGSIHSLANLKHDSAPRGNHYQEDEAVWDAGTHKERSKDSAQIAGYSKKSSGVACVGGYDVPVPAGVYAPKLMFPYPKAVPLMQEHVPRGNVGDAGPALVRKVTLDLTEKGYGEELQGKRKQRHGFQGSSPVVCPLMPAQRTLSDPKSGKLKGDLREQQVVMGKGLQLKTAAKKLYLELSNSLDVEPEGPGAGREGVEQSSGNNSSKKGAATFLLLPQKL